MKKIFLSWLLVSSFIFAQDKNADNIINNVKEVFNKIKDYSVDVNIKVDVSFLKVPEMKAKIYFKQPDKIHIESKGFAMLPRDGLYASPLSFLKNEYTSIHVKDENFEGHNTSVVKIIPLNDKGDVVLTTLWIDLKNYFIRKVESTTKTNGTFTLVMNYGGNKYPLPDSMVFTFNADRMKMPQLQNLDPDEQGRGNRRKKENRIINGMVYITYSNYSVNKGIPDSIFEKKGKNISGK